MIINCKNGLNAKNVKFGERQNFKLQKTIGFIAKTAIKYAMTNRKYLRTISFFDLDNSVVKLRILVFFNTSLNIYY